MKSAKYHALSAATVACLALALCGCSAWREDLVHRGRLALETVNSREAELALVQVYEDRGELVVYGKIRRSPGVQGRLEARVRVGVWSHEGRVGEETKRAFPHYIPLRRNRKSNFTVRFPGIPPNGSFVRIECLPASPVNPSAGLRVFARTDEENDL